MSGLELLFLVTFWACFLQLFSRQGFYFFDFFGESGGREAHRADWFASASACFWVMPFGCLVRGEKSSKISFFELLVCAVC